MKITENALRQIIKEELELLSEVVRNTHGYSVRSVSDVTWTPEKRRIPTDRNPFVGSSPAFDSWYNDGQMTRSWKKDYETKTGDIKSLFGKNDIFFNDGDHVIIPTLDKIDNTYTMPGVIMNLHHKNPAQLGIPGARDNSTIPLVDIRWQIPGSNRTEWLRDVGLAFVVKLGGPRMHDPVAASSSAMRWHYKGREEQDEKDSRRAERDSRRAEREERDGPPRRPEPETQSTAPARTIRRVGGVAVPPPERKPQKMSDDEIRQMLGLKRR
jgi:hypothetical protein